MDHVIQPSHRCGRRWPLQKAVALVACFSHVRNNQWYRSRGRKDDVKNRTLCQELLESSAAAQRGWQLLQPVGTNLQHLELRGGKRKRQQQVRQKEHTGEHSMIQLKTPPCFSLLSLTTDNWSWGEGNERNWWASAVKGAHRWVRTAD